MRVLVIRLGAFGDFVQSFGPFAAIRRHHPDDHITLLTTAPYARLAADAPWFDAIETDARPAWWNIPGVVRLKRQLRGFDLVYDLQTSGRSSRYFRLAGRPRWSGIAKGCALPHANPGRDAMHTRERQREQLAMAGISEFPRPDQSWLPRSAADLPRRYAVLAPGAAPGRPAKRWPAEKYAMLARHLADRGVTPVVIGAKTDGDLGMLIKLICPKAIDLTGRTGLGELFDLAARALVVVGNDTGPMHLAALSGTACLVLFGPDSDPSITAPRGPNGEWLAILNTTALAALDADEVSARADAMLQG